MKDFSGGCLCQKVRYRLSSPPISRGICYCRQCQKSGGAFGSPLMILHQSQFECSEGELSSCTTVSDRGSTVTRHFCRNCGSHLYSQISDLPHILTVKAVTLNDFETFTAEYLVWTQSAPAACPFPAGVPSFPSNAPMEVLFPTRA